jgi:hypothetical protein
MALLFITELQNFMTLKTTSEMLVDNGDSSNMVNLNLFLLLYSYLTLF